MFINKVVKILPRTIKDIIKSIIPNANDPEAMRLLSWRYGKIRREYLSDIFQGIESVEIKIVNCFERVIGTSIDPLETLYLNSIAEFIEPKKVCEVGTYNGNTILNLAANTPKDTVLVTIDLPPDWDGELAISTPRYKYNVTDRNRIGYQYKNTKYEQKIRQIFCDSATLDWDKLDGPFDLIFIDGCHDHRYVRIDTENAIKHLSHTGVIAWHDYAAFKDVSQVVDSFQSKLRIKAIAGTRIALGFKR